MSSELRPRIDAMRPERPGPTRTADPQPPQKFPLRGNYRGYILFGLGASLMLPVSFDLLLVLWSLHAGPDAFDMVMERFRSLPLRIFNALAFLWLVWVALRFFRLFPKTQPFRMGPFKRPPDVVMVAGLCLLFGLVNALAFLLLTEKP